MKKWALLLSFLLLLGLCAACGKAEAPETNWEPGWNIAGESDRKFTDVVEIRITEFNLDENQFTYEMHNTGDVTYCYATGADFKLEVFHEDAWHKMHYEPGWDVTAEEPYLEPGQTNEYSTSYATAFIAELPAGTYRFIKEVYQDGHYSSCLYTCCEFVIE